MGRIHLDQIPSSVSEEDRRRLEAKIEDINRRLAGMPGLRNVDVPVNIVDYVRYPSGDPRAIDPSCRHQLVALCGKIETQLKSIW